MARRLDERLYPCRSGRLTALVVVTFLSVAVRYLFASGSAYVAAMMPVFLTVGLAAGAPPAASLWRCCSLTPTAAWSPTTAGAASPILFGSGYPDLKAWWIVGGVLALFSYAVHMTLGIMWWKMLGLY